LRAKRGVKKAFDFKARKFANPNFHKDIFGRNGVNQGLVREKPGKSRFFPDFGCIFPPGKSDGEIDETQPIIVFYFIEENVGGQRASWPALRRPSTRTQRCKAWTAGTSPTVTPRKPVCRLWAFRRSRRRFRQSH
jgi:hypothetical protein